MDAQIISLAKWKAAHPPILVCWQHGLQAWLAWHDLLIKLSFPLRRL
jgi:hypothetical protein